MIFKKGSAQASSSLYLCSHFFLLSLCHPFSPPNPIISLLHLYLSPTCILMQRQIKIYWGAGHKELFAPPTYSLARPPERRWRVQGSPQLPGQLLPCLTPAPASGLTGVWLQGEEEELGMGPRGRGGAGWGHSSGTGAPLQLLPMFWDSCRAPKLAGAPGHRPYGFVR